MASSLYSISGPSPFMTYSNENLGTPIDSTYVKDGKIDTNIDIVSGISTSFDNIHMQTYKNLARAADNNEDALRYEKQTENVHDLQNNAYDNITKQVNINSQITTTAQRQHEINEWANSDKLDTLFVFQFMFISLMVMAVLGYLWRINVLSSGFLYFSGFLVLVVNILVIVIRSKYTRLLRNTRYWNRRKFNQYPAPAPTGIDASCNALFGPGSGA